MKPVTIAGIKALKVNYLDDYVFIDNAPDEPEAEIYCGYPMTFYGFTEVQVRNILIKFCKECEINGRAYEMGETREDFVDEFINGEVEE